MMEIGIAFVGGFITGVITIFSCIRLAMVLPYFGYPKEKRSKGSSDKIQIGRKRSWDPGSLMPPSYRVPSPSSGYGGPGPSDIEYESPEDLLDPVDPKEVKKKGG
jgi:hypothetical protein